MQRDHSVIARSLRRLSESFPVVEKKAGKWVITDLGRHINEITRSGIAAQKAALNSTATLRIGTNREFAARIIGPQIQKLVALFPNTVIEVHSFEKGSEEALLNGQIDIGIDCDRPFDPEISYKQIVEEPIIAVASPAFLKQHKQALQDASYLKLPHLLCERLYPDKILMKPENSFHYVARFNDIATTRAACLQGVGWALLPRYAIQEELASKKLQAVDQKLYGMSKYGIWWPRHRQYLKGKSEILIEWLKGQDL